MISGRNKQSGFTLLEVALVLVVIGIILGALSIGKDLHRNAVQQRIYSTFIQQWAVAYNEYFARTGVVVGDSQTNPTLLVNGAPDSLLCGPLDGIPLNGYTAAANDSLHNLMDSVGIEMPPGRAEGREDWYVYEDTNGNPMTLRVCFKNIEWEDSVNNKNVMVIYGLNPDLARSLDATIDGRADARFGLFREADSRTDPDGTITGVSTEWSRTNRHEFGSAIGTEDNFDEDQVDVLTAVYRMNQ